jgi:hypothetical protein
MRAILLASATATSLKGFFSISFFAHIRNGSVWAYGETTPHGRRQRAVCASSDCPSSKCARASACRPKSSAWASARERRRTRAGRRNRSILNGRRHCRGGDRAEPGMLISRRAVSSFCASFAMVRSSRAIASSRFRNCTTSGASASHTSNGTVSSQASISSASSRACLGPCAAMTPTSVKWPRKPFSNCVR